METRQPTPSICLFTLTQVLWPAGYLLTTWLASRPAGWLWSYRGRDYGRASGSAPSSSSDCTVDGTDGAADGAAESVGERDDSRTTDALRCGPLPLRSGHTPLPSRVAEGVSESEHAPVPAPAPVVPVLTLAPDTM